MSQVFSKLPGERALLSALCEQEFPLSLLASGTFARHPLSRFVPRAILELAVWPGLTLSASQVPGIF